VRFVATPPRGRSFLPVGRRHCHVGRPLFDDGPRVAQVSEKLRIELFVSDVERSVQFYCTVLGFEQATTGEGSGDYRAVRRGDATIGLGRADRLPEDHPVAAAGSPPGRGVELVLEVSEIDAAYQHVLATGTVLASDLARRPWGLRDFRLLDPDGFYLRVTEAAPS
jgi:lactoylglutathione lyase